MAEASATLHEDAEKLGPDGVDRHRAIASLMEELEAIDWYDQRVRASDDEELCAILAHNRDEEKEHAAMVLEWLRRRDPELDEQLRIYLFTEGSIAERSEAVEAAEAAEKAEAGAPPAAPPGDGSLGIGSLRGKEPG